MRLRRRLSSLLQLLWEVMLLATIVGTKPHMRVSSSAPVLALQQKTLCGTMRHESSGRRGAPLLAAEGTLPIRIVLCCRVWRGTKAREFGGRRHLTVGLAACLGTCLGTVRGATRLAKSRGSEESLRTVTTFPGERFTEADRARDKTRRNGLILTSVRPRLAGGSSRPAGDGPSSGVVKFRGVEIAENTSGLAARRGSASTASTSCQLSAEGSLSSPACVAGTRRGHW